MSIPLSLHPKPSFCSSIFIFRSYTRSSVSFQFNPTKRFRASSACLSNSHNPISSLFYRKPSPAAPSSTSSSSSVDDTAAAAAAYDVRSSTTTSPPKYLKSGSLAVALLSLTHTTLSKVKISPVVYVLASNPTFVSGVLAWFVAQSAKVVLNVLVKKKRWDVSMFFASGGMPSSHTALCTALTTSVALCHGVADSLFPVCVGFTSIVMYDAIGVRRHAGMQAQVLNVIINDLFQGHPIRQRKLKELLGHTPSQVLVGALLGIVVAYISYHGCLVAT